MRTYDDIHNAVLKRNLFFSTLEMFPNFIIERTSNEITNHFTDWNHVCWIEGGVKKVVSIPFTTKMGDLTDNMPVVDGVKGNAVIVFPQQAKSTWRFIYGEELKKQNKPYPFNYPYFEQVGKLHYWRDANREDKTIDETNTQYDIFGTHLHVMSNPPPAWQSGLVKNWSEGCMGAEYKEFTETMVDLAMKTVPIWGEYFTGVLFLSENFE